MGHQVDSPTKKQMFSTSTFCHVRSKISPPPMKQGMYTVYLLLSNESGLAVAVIVASCECAAG